jgi:hypothetical protein
VDEAYALAIGPIGAPVVAWQSRLPWTICEVGERSVLVATMLRRRAVLSRNEATGAKGAPSAETISSPALRPAFSPGSPAITPETKVLPSMSRVKMPIPG